MVWDSVGGRGGIRTNIGIVASLGYQRVRIILHLPDSKHHKASEDSLGLFFISLYISSPLNAVLHLFLKTHTM